MRRPYFDVSIAILRILGQGQVELYELADFKIGRQSEIEVELERGSYVIVPRSTGCLSLRTPQNE